MRTARRDIFVRFTTLKTRVNLVPDVLAGHRKPMDGSDYRKYWPDLLETMTACSISGRVSIERVRALAFDLSIPFPW